jgi:signal transduction histidine kinase/HPt (histidine-containing phosphotransfer) domain-containing protein/ActR/RegA family two-component response regulator
MKTERKPFFSFHMLKTKLLVMSVVSAGAALLGAGAALAAYDYAENRHMLVTNTQTYANIIAGNSTAALSFNDANDATQTLGSLRAEPHVEAACIYDNSGKRMAVYFRGATLIIPDSVPSGGARSWFTQNALIVLSPVKLNGQSLGWVYVQSDLQQLSQRTQDYAMVFGLVLLSAMCLALALSRWFARSIVGPVTNLTKTARTITQDHNYQVRAQRTTNDELGELVDCFNSMLGMIEQRDGQLNIHRHHLEELVAARTVELSAAKDKAEESSRAKTAFLANMSHEIRTPMTAILGYSDLMLSPVQTMSDRVNCLQVVRRNARHLMDLINDILDISKIEAEKMTVERIACDVARLTVDVVSMLRVRAVAKQLTLRVEFAGDIPEIVHTDPLRFKQILMNLTGNAIKFTEQGEVCVIVSVEKLPNGSRVKVDVRDTGIGMTREQISNLFQAFVQADVSMTRRYGGSGLGLVISRRLAEILGGELAVTSELGRGSTFSLTVDGGPLADAPMRHGLTEAMLVTYAQAAPTNEITLRGKILLAEDGVDNQQLLTMHLTMAGAEVVVVPNGREAVEKVKAEPFDLVLMDMQMPELDGYQATSQLRRLGYKLPIIALTAHAMSGDRAKCLDAGCTDYLTKPIDREVLLRSVDGYLRGLGGRDEMPAVEAKPPPPRAPARRSLEELRPVGPDPTNAAMQHAVAAFVSRLPQRVNSLVTLSASQEMDELRRLVHQLKGAGAGYGFPKITDAAKKAETLIKATAQCQEVQTAVDELIELIRSVDGYDPKKEQHAKSEAAHS